ncbi:class I SAM-dependent DNA methyltransferase [Actinomyces trachealis]|uniref:HsdM family class I SAM-dependent methyltransferase n=1 Tax=Actinomyces trachealis TaxID=2763540 RepID=UPI001892BEDD|nr:N-6 DNA methylase [Actinomyces trachealis]
MQYVGSRQVRKSRGAFFTPEPIATFIAQWALRSPTDTVLEPSCGEAIFLQAAARRIESLGGRPTPHQLHGVDLHEQSVLRARDALAARGVQATVSVSDFFDHTVGASVDAVIGNPPYIRYQDFHGRSRSKARAAALAQGVALTALASSWAAFTVHAASFLTRGGRMGLVLPAELLSANYAAAVREYLLRRFTSVRLVLFAERVFPDVQEEVVLLLAQGYDAEPGGTDHFEVVQLHNMEDLSHQTPSRRWTPAFPGEKWTTALASSPAYTQLTTQASAVFTTLSQWGRVSLGTVTGANTFFALTSARVTELGLAPADLVRLSPPGSTHLRRLTLTSEDMSHLDATGKPTFLFFPEDEPSAAGWALIRAGEAAGVSDAYKCRVRSPWWRVPLAPRADLFITYMNDDCVSVCANEADVAHLNSVHGLILDEGLRDLPLPLLALASHNSVTALGAEVVGRAYGGGLLKLEPTEARRLPVPAPGLIRARLDPLQALWSHAREMLVEDGTTALRYAVDDALDLPRVVGAFALEEMRDMRETLTQRRHCRKKTV